MVPSFLLFLLASMLLAMQVLDSLLLNGKNRGWPADAQASVQALQQVLGSLGSHQLVITNCMPDCLRG